MAQKVQIIRISDLSGEDLGDGGQTVKFSVGNDAWELDLSDKEASKFYDVLKPYQDAGQKVAGRGVKRSSGSSGQTRTDPAQLAKIREWAKENGHKVSDRGRIAASVVEAYEAAH